MKPDTPVRIMVLETDKPHPETLSARGSFGDLLHHHFSAVGAEHDPPLTVETEQVFVVTELGGRMPDYTEFDGFNGLLITGSVYDAHDDNPWILQLLDLLRVLWIRKPAFRFSGVCFGHQLLARLLGGQVGPSPARDWELGHCAIELTDTGRRLFAVTEPEPVVYLHQMHQGQVKTAPTTDTLTDAAGHIQVWGRSDHTPIQGLYLANRLFTSQAHLAFDEDMVKRQIEMRQEAGAVQDAEHATRAKETAHLEHDGKQVAAAILRMFWADVE